MGNHRADRSVRPDRAAAATPPGTIAGTTAGRRKAVKPSRRIGVTRSSKLTYVPSVLGLAAMAVAGTGAATVHPVMAASATSETENSSQHQGTDASLLPSSTDAIGFTGRDRRVLALSRDSERQALEDRAAMTVQAQVDQEATERNAALKQLGRAAEARAAEIARNLWQLPTSGYRLTARFGAGGGLWSSNHTGLDFAASSGTAIRAVANGVIVSTEYAGAYGNRTVQRLDDGTEIWYCHQNSFGVSPGESVVGGQTIGELGSTGNSTGPHLHLEVRPGGGDPVDPYAALLFHGVTP